MKSSRVFFVYVSLAAIFWGLNFHLGKVMMHSCSAVEAGFWRYALGVLALLIFSLNSLPDLKTIRSSFKATFLVGFVGLFSFNYFFFVGLSGTSALNASLIMGLNPALTLLLSHFLLGFVILRSHWVGIVLALLGVAFLLVEGDISQLVAFQLSRGDMWILLANVAFAFYHVWVKIHSHEISNGQFTLLTNIYCLLGFVLILPLYGGTGPVSSYPTSFWMASLGMGIFGTAVAYYLWNMGIQQLGSARTGIFINVAPLSTGLFALFFGESIEMYHLISGILVISGIVIMQRS